MNNNRLNHLRWAVVAVILIVWTLAMFPMKDGNFLDKYHQMAAKQVAKSREAAEQLKGNPQETLVRLNAIEDKSSDEYKKLAEELKALQADPNFSSWVVYSNYQELEKRLALLQNKSLWDAAEAIKAKMAKLNAGDGEYAVLASQYEAAVAKIADWMKTEEYAEFSKRLPVALEREALEAREDVDSAEYKALLEKIEKEEEAFAEPAFDDPVKLREYRGMLSRLSLVLSSERITSGFRMLEKAANGNSEAYRIALSDFINIPFVGKTSNKTILRAIRVKTAGKLHLGLDLQGGTEFVLEFDKDEAVGSMVNRKSCQEFLASVFANEEASVKALTPELKALIDGAVAAQKAKTPSMENSELAILLADNEEVHAALKSFLTEHTELLPKTEQQGYGSVVEIRDRIINILDNRLNGMGVTEPEIKATGDNTISVRMPSVDEADKNEIRNTIKRAAKLQFFLVAQNNSELIRSYEADPQNFRTPAGLTRTEMEMERNGLITYETIFLESRPTPVKGEDVDRAVPTTNEFGQWRIALRFNSAGTAAFRTVTRENVGRQLAIVLDGRVYSAPRINEAIEGGSAEITGSFGMEEAKQLASVIASGNVPVTVFIGSEMGTDPTLGADSVRSGMYAGLIGLGLVVLFMIWYYRLAGLVSVIALSVNTLLVLGSMSILKATITMPGIAGMVLTIGMAIDANVIIFERIREELNTGKTLLNALESGYSKAFSAILDSNITTLLTCFFLYNFGTGTVKGFAVTLAFGIIASFFTAVFMTRLIFETLVELGWITTLKMRGFDFILRMKVDILKARKAFFVCSAVLVVICLATFILRGRDMLGIDFAGGTELAYKCEGGAPNVEAVRGFLVEKGYPSNVRVGYKRGQSGEPLLEIVLPAPQEGKQNVDITEFSNTLDQKFPEVRISLLQTNNIGASVGSQFRTGALKAAILSILGIIIYLAFRFEARFGYAAAVAVVHDCIIAAGLFVLLNGKISLTVIAAVMTILGYSLNDTIVIFDRIRETKGLKKGASFYDRVNLAVNDCMSRTLITTLTTLFAVATLCILGGGSIFDFALVMLFGVLVGTYSSVCIAPALVNAWNKKS